MHVRVCMCTRGSERKPVRVRVCVHVCECAGMRVMIDISISIYTFIYTACVLRVHVCACVRPYITREP
jgi:hypothetical protein